MCANTGFTVLRASAVLLRFSLDRGLFFGHGPTSLEWQTGAIRPISDPWNKALVNAVNVEVRNGVLTLHRGRKNCNPKKMSTPNLKGFPGVAPTFLDFQVCLVVPRFSKPRVAPSEFPAFPLLPGLGIFPGCYLGFPGLGLGRRRGKRN